MENLDPVKIIIISVAAGLILIIILREVCCWYFKINERIKLMTEQNKLLTEIRDRLDPKPSPIEKKVDN
jgi:hypothetical protein